MVGITTTTTTTRGGFFFKPPIYLNPSKTTPFPFITLFSSSHSNLFGLHLLLVSPITSRAFFASTTTTTNTTVCRYAGPRSPQSTYGDDRALDVFGIRSATVRLIDKNQNMVGIVPKNEAMQMAEDDDLDLVILSPDADPPVVRIMDYNKHRYEQQKKKKGQQKKNAAVLQMLANRMDLKELKMGYNIDQHDYEVRLKAARKFLKDCDKVKVIVNLKGRENQFRNIAIELIRRFQNDVGELATEESKNFSDRNIFITLVPNKAALQKAQEQPKKKDRSAVNEVSAGV